MQRFLPEPRSAVAHHGFSEGVAVGRIPARGVAVLHVREHGHHPRSWRGPVRGALRCQWKGNVMQPRKPKGWRCGGREPQSRIPYLAIDLVAFHGPAEMIIESGEEACAVSGNGEGEAGIDPDERGGDGPAP